MPEINSINYRRIELTDLFPVMNLYQLSCEGEPRDTTLLDRKRLIAALECDEELWYLAEKGDELLGVFSMMLDWENRLAKINRVVIHPQWKDTVQVLHGALPLLIDQLRPNVDVIYTTTRTLSLKQQEMTLGLGFKVLGIFPNAVGADETRVNGISAYFIGDVLKEQRQSSFRLHPRILPFYELVREQANLPELAVYDGAKPDVTFEPVPTLEMIHAPNFVAHRFEMLKQRKSLSIHFYPFQHPNALVTGPQQKIEIFVKVIPEMRFAAIIGERMDSPVNPTDLYNQVSLLLNSRNITYIEMINDAGDSWGIDCILKAGYQPCVYFPGFKKQVDSRRDYVVLSRSFERLYSAKPVSKIVNPYYNKFLSRYFHQEEEMNLKLCE